MKRIFSLLILAVLLLPTGCNDDDLEELLEKPIVDWYPVNVIITLQDSAGNDLLDPSKENSLVHGTTLTYKGEKYGVQSIIGQVPATETKAYMARIRGLQLDYGKVWISQDVQKTCHFLVFGEIDGAVDMDEDLVVKWPDGSKDVITYHCSDHKVEKQRDGTWLIDCKRSWELNEKPATPPFQLVK